MVTGGEYFSTVDASRNVIGTIAAVPSPTRQKPIRQIQNVGKRTEIVMPATISMALNVKVGLMPICSINQSVAKRDWAMQIINVRYPSVKSSTPTTSLK